MRIAFTDEQIAFRDQLRDYFGHLMTPELTTELRGDREGGGSLYHQTLRTMGKDGWLGIGWPKEYGGQGRTPIEQWIFADEVQRAGFPLPFLTLNTVGPTLRNYASEEQKQEFLPRVLAGEIHFAIGYSEPEAGTDLASLKTRAVRDGDDWLISGQKLWTSQANYADYIWLAARTDPDASKHRGISMFLVPTSAEGYSISPIYTVGGVRTNATFYEGVRVPSSLLIGGENNGWSLITGQLNHERVSLMNSGAMRRLLSDLIDWARETRLHDGSRVIDQPWVQSNLARVVAKTEVLRLMNMKQAWTLQYSNLHPADASTVKVYGSELYVEGYRAMLEVLGPHAIIDRDSPGAVLAGRIESSYRNALILTFGGGTNEVQRDIIAMAGLGLPHYKS